MGDPSRGALRLGVGEDVCRQQVHAVRERASPALLIQPHSNRLLEQPRAIPTGDAVHRIRVTATTLTVGDGRGVMALHVRSVQYRRNRSRFYRAMTKRLAHAVASQDLPDELGNAFRRAPDERQGLHLAIAVERGVQTLKLEDKTPLAAPRQ